MLEQGLTSGHTSVCQFAGLLLLAVAGHCFGIDTDALYRKWSYCETDVFRASCGGDQVVVMEMALYGRMRLGKCVQTDYGYVGCHTNALDNLDSVCSGRRSCQLGIPEKALAAKAEKECPGEFKTYLEANFSCINVEGEQCQMCQKSHSAQVRGESGFIASIVTNETRNYTDCGSSRCPWSIKVEPGQRINLTLYDFTLESGRMSDRTKCFRFAVIKERVKSATSGDLEIREEPVCDSQQRIRHLHTSIGHEIEIHVVSPEVFSSRGHFLFHYQGLPLTYSQSNIRPIGCADIPTEPNVWFKRDPANNDEATVGCKSSDETWSLKCEDRQWKGDNWQCPPIVPLTEKPTFTLPLGVLIAIIIGIALVIGVLILTIGLVCLKSYVHRQQPVTYRRPDTYGCSRTSRGSTFHEDMSAATPLQYAKHSPDMTTDKRHIPLNIRENVYMESRPLPSIPTLNNEADNDDKSDRSSKIQVYRTSSGREHYHNPRLVVNTRREPPYGLPYEFDQRQYDPQYFVLDPDDELPVELPQSPCCVAAAAAAAGPRRLARGGVSSAKQKSPEEENAENFCKEVASLDSSCHEIPIRLGPPVAGPSHVADESRAGNSSWP